MKVLVLGGAGMLGHKMVQTLGKKWPDTACTVRTPSSDPLFSKVDLFRKTKVFHDVDVMNLEALERQLAELRPEYIVNCVGVVKQRAAAKDRLPSIAVNSLLPHKLANAAEGWGGRVIHFSTDCVFSGATGKYTEQSPSDAEDVYGKTKYLGEVATANALTLRTSIIGRELSHFASLLEWFLAQEGKTIRGFRNVLYSGVTTNYLSELVCRIIAEQPKLSGLHQVASPEINKYDLLMQVRELFHVNVEILPDESVVSDRTMIGTPFFQTTGFSQPSWPDMLAELAADPTPYQDWR